MLLEIKFRNNTKINPLLSIYTLFWAEHKATPIFTFQHYSGVLITKDSDNFLEIIETRSLCYKLPPKNPGRNN